MDYPLLIAQTPRAGRWNHLNLLPPGPVPPGLDPGSVLAAASANPVGRDYLAAARVVEQAGSTKLGRELLALVGVRLPDGDLRARVQGWLGERLAELGEVIVRIDWAAHDGSDRELPELARWAEEARGLFGLRRRTRLTISRAAVVLALVVGLAALGAGLAAGWPRARDRAGDGPPPAPAKKSGGGPAATRAEEVAKAWEALLDDVLSKPKDGAERTGESELVEEMCKALDRVGGVEVPRAVTDGAHAERVTWLRNKHAPFREWLGKYQGRPPFLAVVPLGDHDTAELRKVEGVAGSLGSAGEVVRALRRVNTLRGFLREARAIGLPAKGMDDETKKGQPLLSWAERLRSAEVAADPFAGGLPEVPFLTRDLLRECSAVQRQMSELGQALCDQPQFADGLKGVTGTWLADPKRRAVVRQAITEVVDNRWNKLEWATRDTQAKELLKALVEVLRKLDETDRR